MKCAMCGEILRQDQQGWGTCDGGDCSERFADHIAKKYDPEAGRALMLAYALVNSEFKRSKTGERHDS